MGKKKISQSRSNHVEKALAAFAIERGGAHIHLLYEQWNPFCDFFSTKRYLNLCVCERNKRRGMNWINWKH